MVNKCYNRHHWFIILGDHMRHLLLIVFTSLTLASFSGSISAHDHYDHYERHERVYAWHPWYHPHYVAYHEGYYYPHYIEERPYYLYTPQYYYYQDEPGVSVNLHIGG